MSMQFSNSQDYLQTSYTRSKVNKSCVAIGILSALTFSLFISVLVLATRDRDVNVNVVNFPKIICRERFCQQTVDDLSKIMDTSLDPCEDFYNFTCGNWHLYFPANDSVPVTSPFQRLQNSVLDTLSMLLKLFPHNDPNTPHGLASFIFHQCVADSASQRKEDIEILIEEFGGWPILSRPNDTVQIEDVRSVIDYNFQALRNFDLSVILKFVVIPHPVEADKFILTISSSDLLSDLLSTYFNAPVENYAMNLKSIRAMVCFLKGNCDFDWLANDIENIGILNERIESVTNTLQYSSDNVNLPDIIKNMKMTLGDLDAKIKLPESENWVDSLSRLFNGTNVAINKETEVFVDEIAVANIIKILGVSDIRTVKNWFVAKVLFELGPKFSSVFGRPASNEHRCASEVNNLMPYVAASVYNLYWSQRGHKKELVLNMINEVKQTIQSRFASSNWLDDDAKLRLTDKLNNVVAHVGFPEWILDEKELNKYYPLYVYPNATYIDASRALLNLKWLRKANLLNQKFVRQEYWISSDLINVNAWYHPLVNSITIPISILDYPFLPDVSQPRSVTYGILGHLIAHEIFHGFDPKGIYFDGNGKVIDRPFSNEVVEKYYEKVTCLIDQYPKKDSNEAQTITEDFPDNAAASVVFETLSNSQILQNDFLPNFNQSLSKQFHIAFATTWCKDFTDAYLQILKKDVHSLGKYRATIPLKNSDWFARAFGCKPNSEMNPQSGKCRII